jgi:hypothetical protein
MLTIDEWAREWDRPRKGERAKWVAFDEAAGLDQTAVATIFNSKRDQAMATRMVSDLPPIFPLTLEGAPNGGYIVRGGQYEIGHDSMRGLAFAGELEACLEYMRNQMVDARRAREPKPAPKICDCQPVA